MKFDYVANLLESLSSSSLQIEQWTAHYAFYVASDKDKADEWREKWKTLYLINRQPPGIGVAEATWQGLFEPSLTLDALPIGSFFIQYKFRLSKPYISKDENDFYIIDNPIVRDKVFHWPIVRPTSWKGSLRFALWQLGYQENNEQVKYLFGEELSDETGIAGKLLFYSTFFTSSSLEIINPHDREKRIGKAPILVECVPAGETGTFTLLYVPFDRIGEKDTQTCRQAVEDLRLVAEGIRAMMTVHGFGAKTSSGFGTAKEQCQGSLQVKMVDPVSTTQPVQPPTKPDKPAVLRAFWQKYPDEDFTLKPKAWREQHKATNTEKNEYLAAKQAYLLYQAELAAYETVVTGQQEDIQAEPVPTLTERTFSSFSEMVQKVEELAGAMDQEGENV